MLGGQPVERGVDPPGVLGREVVVLLIGDVDPVEELGGLATPPEPAERPIPRDPIEPRRERPGVGQPWDASNDVAPDVLQGVLDVRRRPEELPDVVAEPRPVSLHDFAERGLVADLAADDEQTFVDPPGIVGHASLTRSARSRGRSRWL